MRIPNLRNAMLAAALMMAIAPAPVFATLVNRGDGTVFDSVTHLVWLEDWNVNGAHDWATQVAWADSLVFAGSDQWLLPRIDQYILLYADAGGTATGIANNFLDVQANNDYWSSSDFLRDPAFSALFFPAIGTSSEGGNKALLLGFATAVRADAITGSVPEPGTLPLVAAAGVAGLISVSWRRRPDRPR